MGSPKGSVQQRQLVAGVSRKRRLRFYEKIERILWAFGKSMGTISGLVSPLCIGSLLELSKGDFSAIGLFFGTGHCDISDCVAIVAEERPEHGEQKTVDQ